jgi:hypothetical protein
VIKGYATVYRFAWQKKSALGQKLG